MPGRGSRDLHGLVPPALRPLSRAAGRVFRRAQHALRNRLSTPKQAPIFVLGNQKSGTSAIADLLGRACGLSVSVDMLMEVERPTYHRIPSGDLPFADYVRRNRFEFAHDVVKEPNLTFLYPQLVQAFPRSPIVFIVRDPRDQIRSLLNALEVPGDLAALEPRHVAPLNPGWKLVIDCHWLGVPGEHYVEHLAHRWNRAADVYLGSRERAILCRYEDFLADKLGALQRLADALGRPVVRDVAAEVDRQYQTRGDRAADWRSFFGAENLARIERTCAERMRAFDYPVTSTP